jgi:leader peptidase (prepilin peptidase) / N-methyltransferase
MSEGFVNWWLAHPSLFGLPFHFWSGVIFLVGAFVGSFLNVCIHRMPLGQSVVTPPSHCPHCRYRIPALLNLPVLTWLWLRGRCRNCAAPISPRYLAVELLTALLFLGAWLRCGDRDPALALALCVLAALFLVATFIDFAHFIIPDEITLGGAGAGLVLSVLAPGLHGAAGAGEALKSGLLGVAVGWGVVYGVVRLGKLLFGRERVAVAPGSRVVFHEHGLRLPDREVPFEDVFYRKSDTVRLRGRRIELADRCYAEADIALSMARLRVGPDEFAPEGEPYLAAETDQLVLPREAMGFGDVKFMATIGAFLGWPATLFTLAAASVTGAVVGVTLIVIGRREWSARLPFGPYLALGATLWVLGGAQWWSRLWGAR